MCCALVLIIAEHAVYSRRLQHAEHRPSTEPNSAFLRGRSGCRLKCTPPPFAAFFEFAPNMGTHVYTRR
eukprot:6192855-Pleurochrysis_carterae.AAC.5